MTKRLKGEEVTSHEHHAMHAPPGWKLLECSYGRVRRPEAPRQALCLRRFRPWRNSQGEERNMDGRQIAGEPCWQVDVGDRTVLGAERLGNIGERTAESVGREDQALRSDHSGRDGRPPVRPVR
jgi:hypothetical protein